MRKRSDNLHNSDLRKLQALYITSGSQNFPKWSRLIRYYFSLGFFKECLLLHVYSPNRTHQPFLPLVLKACGSISLLALGKSIHAESIKTGQDFDIIVGTTLISMYLKSRKLDQAREVFDGMPERNAVTYNAMIGGYSENGDMDSACAIFNQMPSRTPVSWMLMIEGYAKIKNSISARWVFDRIPVVMKTVAVWTAMVHGYTINAEMDAAKLLFDEMPSRNFFVWSSMVSGYFKIGDVKKGREVFDQISNRNLVNWNSLIGGYTRNGCCEEAIKAFEEMQKDGFEPDEFTVAIALSACAQLGSLETGRKIHQLIEQKGIKQNQFVSCGLLDMYLKCGDLETGRRIFQGMKFRNLVCWNTMISGLSSHGMFEEAMDNYAKMSAEEKPDSITFLALLTGCTHRGLIREGFEVFEKMKKCQVVPEIEHYGCLVDLLGRSGKLDEAYDLIKKMPMEPNDIVLGSFLGACRVHLKIQMAEKIITEYTQVDSAVFDSVFFLKKIYAASNRWEDAEKLRESRVYINGMNIVYGSSSVI